jgi:hypothetical protein
MNHGAFIARARTALSRLLDRLNGIRFRPMVNRKYASARRAFQRTSPQSGHITCYLNRTYHVLPTVPATSIDN